jgi:hypothetical protein
MGFLEKLNIFNEVLRGFKGKAAALFLLIISAGFLESFSIALLIPFLALITSQGTEVVGQNLNFMKAFLDMVPEHYQMLAVIGALAASITLKATLSFIKDYLKVSLCWGIPTEWQKADIQELFRWGLSRRFGT